MASERIRSARAEETDETSVRVLDATLEVLSDRGLGRLALEDVASAAGVSRQTVYRHFGSRDGLIEAVIVREEQRLIQRMTRRAEAAPSPRGAVQGAIEEAIVAAREHPLLDRLLATEPEVLLPFLTLNHGPVLSAARPVVEELLERWLPDAEPARVRGDADALTRLIVSYAIAPGAESAEELGTRLAALVLDGLLRPE